MNNDEAGAEAKVDRILEKLADYASALQFEDLSPVAVHATKVRVIDTFGALMGGFGGEPCRISRGLAAAAACAEGATIIGTRVVTTPEMAAFANAATSRYVEANDVYRWPKSTGGHPSDIIMPVFAAAEFAKADGQSLIAAVVLAYDIFCHISDGMDAWGSGVEPTNFARMAVSAAAAKLWGLTHDQIAQAISMSAVTGNLVRQVRTGHLSAWKALASGEAGRAGIASAVMAKAGLQGPQLPFEGKHGWCNDISRHVLDLSGLGAVGMPRKIETTLIKQRTTCAATISSVLAAENVAPAVQGKLEEIQRIKVDVYEAAKRGMGTGEHHWHPDSRETADHSIPYVVAATLFSGTVTPGHFDEAYRQNPLIRNLLEKIEVFADNEFTALYIKHPAEHHARVTVTLSDGQELSGLAGGRNGDLSNPKTDREIEDKFRGLAEGVLGTDRLSGILDRMWNLERLENVAQLSPAFVATGDRP